MILLMNYIYGTDKKLGRPNTGDFGKKTRD
jgi:hypothetical protein